MRLPPALFIHFIHSSSITQEAKAICETESVIGGVTAHSQSEQTVFTESRTSSAPNHPIRVTFLTYIRGVILRSRRSEDDAFMRHSGEPTIYIIVHRYRAILVNRASSSCRSLSADVFQIYAPEICVIFSWRPIQYRG